VWSADRPCIRALSRIQSETSRSWSKQERVMGGGLSTLKLSDLSTSLLIVRTSSTSHCPGCCGTSLRPNSCELVLGRAKVSSLTSSRVMLRTPQASRVYLNRFRSPFQADSNLHRGRGNGPVPNPKTYMPSALCRASYSPGFYRQ
jgi:hypothetical protein